VLQHVLLRSISHADHPGETPAFEQLTFTFTTDGEEDEKRRPCVHVDEVAADRLRVRIGTDADSVAVAHDFNVRLRRLREKIPSESIYQSIEQVEGAGVSFIIKLSQPAPYRFFPLVEAGNVLFVLQVRSFRGPWIRMDPDNLKSVFGERSVIAAIEYRLPTGAERDVVEVLVRIRQSSGRESETSVYIPNVPIKLQDERFIARQVLQATPASVQRPPVALPQPPTATPLPPRVEPTSPAIAAFAFDSLRNQAEAIRRKAGPAARETFIFGRLEEFARLESSPKYKAAYRAIEQSYSNASVSGDDRFLFRLFANFASARLAGLNEATAAAEIPRAGAWSAAPAWNGQPRPSAAPLVEPVFDDSIWSWQQRLAAVAYNVGTHHAALHTRNGKEAFDSESLRRYYGNNLLLEVAGSYTTPHGSIAALAARDGVIAGFLPRSWEGLVIIRDGRLEVISALELTTAMLGGGKPRPLHIFSVPEDFAEFLELVRKNRISLVQGHLLTLRGKYDASANDTLSARRRVLMTGGGNDASSVAVVDFADSRDMTLRQCAKWLGSFDKDGTALNLDTGTWDFGRVYSDSRMRSLGVQTQSDAQLSNKFVFSRNVGSRNDG